MSVVSVRDHQPATHLMDRRMISVELGVSLHGAETLMRALPLIPVGRRVYVERAAVYAELKRRAKR